MKGDVIKERRPAHLADIGHGRAQVTNLPPLRTSYHTSISDGCREGTWFSSLLSGFNGFRATLCKGQALLVVSMRSDQANGTPPDRGARRCEHRILHGAGG
jgi:hypothetical protein